MENKNIEVLKSRCKEVSIFDIADAGSKIETAFSTLAQIGREGQNVKFKWAGRTFYSFMTEDEMYVTLCGKTKAERLEELNAEKTEYQKRREYEAQICREAKETKFDGWMTVIEDSFSKEMFNIIKNSTAYDLESGMVGRIDKMDKMTQMILTAKTDPDKARELYLASATTTDARLFNYYDLCNSYYGEVFQNLIIEDFEKQYSVYGKDKINSLVDTVLENVQKAKTDMQNKKQLGEE